MAKLDEKDLELKAKITRRLIELRSTSGKNQTDFAYEYGKDKQTQNKWETGARGASIYTINKFCKAIDITLSEFFDSPIFDDPQTPKKKK